jgi:hypothetical protein
MFQNLGEVLVAHHSPLRLAAVNDCVAQGLSQDDACLKELGFTYLRLAAEVAAHWKLSPYLTSLWDQDMPATELTQFARFGHELTRLMCVRTASHQEPGLKLLAIKYSASLHLSVDGIADIWERSVEDTKATFANLGVSTKLLVPPLS